MADLKKTDEAKAADWQANFRPDQFKAPAKPAKKAKATAPA